MKTMYEVGDVFVSDLGQTVMLCEVERDSLYKLIVISNSIHDYSDRIGEDEDIVEGGYLWDEEEFKSEIEATEFIKSCENLVNYVENVRTTLTDLYKTNIQ